jgi:hypothetical protein
VGEEEEDESVCCGLTDDGTDLERVEGLIKVVLREGGMSGEKRMKRS